MDYQLRAKLLVAQYYNSKVEKTDQLMLTTDDIYVVWFSKTLQNWKALLSTNVSDGMYYEVTHNGDKEETYIDAYKKWENVCVRDTVEVVDGVDLMFDTNEFTKLVNASIHNANDLRATVREGLGVSDLTPEVDPDEPTQPGFYRYSGGAQTMLFLLDNEQQWHVIFNNGTFDTCLWGYIEQALGVWDLVLIESDENDGKIGPT